MTRAIILTDERLAAALEELAGQPDAMSLMLEVSRAIEAVPQRRRRGRLPMPFGGMPLAASLALMAAVVALVGAIAVGTGLLRVPWDVSPQPPPAIPRATDADAPVTSVAPTPSGPAPTPLPAEFGAITVSDAGCAILAIDPQTTSTERVSEGLPNCYAGPNRTELAWSHDGRMLAIGYDFFCGGCGTERARAAIENRVSGLWVLDTSTGVFEQLVQCAAGCPIDHVRWSPTGSRIAYVLDGEVWVVAVDGHEDTRFATRDEIGAVVDVTWSPAGTHLAVAGRDEVLAARWNREGETASWTAPNRIVGIDWTQGDGVLRVATRTAIGTVVIGPNGELDDSAELNVLHAVDHGRIDGARWTSSPDGPLVAFATAASRDVEYWVASQRGGEPIRVFAAPWDVDLHSDPVWSPDGDEFAFTLVPSSPSMRAQTVIVSPSGSNVRRVEHERPTWDFVADFEWRARQ